MQAVNSRVVGLVALEPGQPICRNDSDVPSPRYCLYSRSGRQAATRQLDNVADPVLPTRIVHANLTALMLDLQRELQTYYAKMDRVL
jgi:hypothetical protein